jgi:hypothetical protein
MSFDSKDEVAPAATAEATAPATAEATAPEDEASLRARAEQFAQTLRREDVEGLKDIQNHMISMGLPATRALLRQFVEHSTAAGSPEQTRALKAVADLSPVTEVGCMRVDFHDRIANCGNTAYITLEECPRDHDLGAQLGKLQSRCAEAKWPEVLTHLSRLVFFGRSVYAQSARALQPELGAAFVRYPGVQVDAANTTLYLEEAWPRRAGIFVRLRDEIKTPKKTRKASHKK